MRYVESETIHVPVAAAVVAGNLVALGDTLGVCQLTTAGAGTTVLGMPGAARYDEAPKHGTPANQIWAQGDKLYWDEANSRFTKTEAGNKLAAIARVAAASPDLVGSVILIVVLQT